MKGNYKVVVACVLAGVLVQVNMASAALVVQEPVAGQKITLDTSTELSWYWDMAGFINKTYDEQISAIAGLNAGSGFAGLTGWHMVSQDEMNGLFGGDYFVPDILAAFGPTYSSSGSLLIQGRVDEVHSSGTGHWVALCGTGTSGWHGVADSAALSDLSAWVVTENCPAVPVPGAVLLGIIGWGCIGMKLRRHR